MATENSKANYANAFAIVKTPVLRIATYKHQKKKKRITLNEKNTHKYRSISKYCVCIVKWCEKTIWINSEWEREKISYVSMPIVKMISKAFNKRIVWKWEKEISIIVSRIYVCVCVNDVYIFVLENIPWEIYINVIPFMVINFSLNSNLVEWWNIHFYKYYMRQIHKYQTDIHRFSILLEMFVIVIMYTRVCCWKCI